jgi:DmsE family decaheme c-type cytochrome
VARIRSGYRPALGWALAALAAGLIVGVQQGCLVPPETVAWSAGSAACADCHGKEAQALREDRGHRTVEAGCLACHGAHALGSGSGPVPLLARCEECHPAERARFALPFRHPLEAADCTSCHPPHGLAPRALRLHLRRDACVECHREYAGPFQFEHEGNRALGCLSCHESHGSANRRLLTHSETRMLCMSCHTNLEQSHRQNPGSVFRECLNCHTEVHGSHWNRELLR